MSSTELPFDIDSIMDTVLADVTRSRMLVKLEKARLKGRGGWFEETCDITYLYDLMIEHTTKQNGDMLDVVNLAAMIAYRSANSEVEKEILIAHISSKRVDKL